MNRIIPILILLATYLALIPATDFWQIILGCIIAVGILGLLHPARRPVPWAQLPSAFLAAAIYLVVLIRNVIHSGLIVTRIILHPKMPLKAGIIAFPPECHSEYGRALGAHAISLPPGELLIEMAEDGTMFIHSLDVETSERMVANAQDRRQGLLRRIFDEHDGDLP